MEDHAPCIQLVYVSAATAAFSQADLRELLTKARPTNSKLHISGLLLYHNRSFFQILEGPEEPVLSLYARIGKDKRHQNVLLLSKRKVEERNFEAWSMGFVDMDRVATKLPGFIKLLEAKSSFLDLQGDTQLAARLIDGFQEGRWRQSIE
ncbi:MAG: BLUF domain-containing protein [Proteobacteria bacterium]|nr:BLUF domain-containing protein [Pseudomonadota bacterium]